MARSFTRSIAFLAITCFSTVLFAQGTMDIGLFNNGNGALEVKVRPTTEFNGVFSSVVFSLRWDKNTDITLGDAVSPENAPLNTRRSGQLREDGNFNYMVFAGFGFDEMAQVGMNWEAGAEYTILSIPVSGVGAVELVNDNWTNALHNNGDFYVSLGGMDKTGTIYKSLAATADLEGTVMIKPNPNEGHFSFSFISEEPVDLRIEVLNTLGQTAFNENLRGFSGTYVKEMDLTTMSEGIYYLRLTRGATTSVHKIVYH